MCASQYKLGAASVVEAGALCQSEWLDEVSSGTGVPARQSTPVCVQGPIRVNGRNDVANDFRGGYRDPTGCFVTLCFIAISAFTTAEEADENSLLPPRAISSETFFPESAW